MFCLMDVSASMTEDLKELSKRFFMLLHLFLSRHYAEVDIVFIRHTTQAQEVDEETFFRATETGGTVISSALEEMMQGRAATAIRSTTGTSMRRRRQTGTTSTTTWTARWTCCRNEILPICQYYAYIEVYSDEHMSPFLSVVWSGYETIDERTRELRDAAGFGAG